MEDRVSGLQIGKEVFCSYRNDDEQVISGYFILISLSETLLELKSNQNLIVIPVSRLIKIKQRFENGR